MPAGPAILTVPPPPAESSRVASFITFASILAIVAILRIAEDVVVPLAISVLLAFLLSPLVNRIARWGMPEVVAVGATAALAFAILAAVGWAVGTQAVAVVEDLPQHEANIRAKVRSLQSLAPGGAFSRTTGMVNELAQEAQSTQEPKEVKRSRREDGEQPVPVVIAGERESRLQMFQRLLAPAMEPLGTAGIVIVFVLVILFQRHDLRDRFINVISAGRMNVATQAVDDAARRISRYLGMQLFVNATYGIPVAVGLYFIGVPGALLWGLLAMVLRFIPFIGPWIAAAFPVVLAAAIDPGWSKLAYTVALFVVLELVSNNVVEVVVYGTSTGISSFALLVAAVFWTWLWGTAGLFLSTPLTVCLLVMGKYVPGLKFLSVVLGNEPSMAAPALFYQRMLSMNFDGMHALARQHAKDRSVEAFYDGIFIPALIMAEDERHSGALAENRQRFIVQAGADLVEELANDDVACSREGSDKDASAAVAARVVVIPAGDEADELCALMLRHVLECRGHTAAVSPLTTPHDACLELLRRSRAEVAIVSSLPPAAVTIARKTCRRLKRDLPDLPVVVGVWSPESRGSELSPRLRLARPAAVVTSLAEAASTVERLLDVATTEPEHVAAAEAGSPVPVASPSEILERVRRELAAIFEVPVSLVKVADVDRPFWAERPWFAEQVDVVGTALRETALGTAGPEETVIEIPDLRKDKRLTAHPMIEERGLRYLACAPLRASEERVVGLLCIVDSRVRTAVPQQLQALEMRAAEFMASVEPRTSAV